MLERARWLFENGLYRRLETLSLSIFNMQDISLENRLIASQYLGFALMQQGKLNEAERQFQESLKIAQQLQTEDAIIEIENNFGQLAALSGKYDEAAKYYWKIIKILSTSSERRKLGSMYSAFGFVLARQGRYWRALMHCQYALKLFEKYPNIREQIRAFINIGTVCRLSGDYGMARTYLIKARKLAENEKFIELEADILRELAHNSHLRGCRAREETDNFIIDCNDQAQALSALMISLDKARTIGSQLQISSKYSVKPI